MNKLLMIFFALFAGTAFAEAPTYTLQLPVLNYSQSVIDPGKTHVTELITSQRERAWLSASVDQFLFYYYPFDTVRTVSVSYLIGSLEVGVDLGLNHLKTNPPTDQVKTNTLGVYVGVFPKITENIGGEFYLQGDRIRLTGTKEDSEVRFYRASADFTYPLSPKISYVAGINYVYIETSDYFHESVMSIGTYGLNIATLRLSF